MTIAARAPADDPSNDDLAATLHALRGRGAHADVAVALAIRHVVRGAEPDVAAVRAALQHAPHGSAAWYLPVEPMIRPMRDVRLWTPALVLLRSRAG
jgi:hypothetical protein